MKKTLNLNALEVESFSTSDEMQISTGTFDRCTGCPSTCGIIGPMFTDEGCL